MGTKTNFNTPITLTKAKKSYDDTFFHAKRKKISLPTDKSYCACPWLMCLPCMLTASIQLISDNNEKLKRKKKSAFHGVVGACLKNFFRFFYPKTNTKSNSTVFLVTLPSYTSIFLVSEWKGIFLFFYYPFPFSLCAFTVYLSGFWLL